MTSILYISKQKKKETLSKNNLKIIKNILKIIRKRGSLHRISTQAMEEIWHGLQKSQNNRNRCLDDIGTVRERITAKIHACSIH